MLHVNFDRTTFMLCQISCFSLRISVNIHCNTGGEISPNTSLLFSSFLIKFIYSKSSTIVSVFFLSLALGEKLFINMKLILCMELSIFIALSMIYFSFQFTDINGTMYLCKLYYEIT